MTYRPLPEGLRIGDSKIHGQGVIATRDFPSDHWFGVARYDIPDGPSIDPIRTPLGGFINHSDTPNCRIRAATSMIFMLDSIVDIAAGEELTISYTMYDPTDG